MKLIIKEILKYYKDFLFETKINEINQINEIIKNNKGNYEEYLKDLENARNMNERYEIIKYIYDSRFKDEEKKEIIMDNCVKSWNQFERAISEKKIKKLRKEDKLMLLEYFKDERNKEKILKIFNEDAYKYFIEEVSKLEKKNENIDYSKLEEVLKYYKDFLFKSKKIEINNINEIIKNNKGNFEEYLNDLDTAKKMNERFGIIKYIYDLRFKDEEKSEANMNNCVQSWDQFEKAIKNKKLVKLRKQDKLILLEYFKNEKNKDKLLKIFNEDVYENFIEEVSKLEKKNENVDYSKLKEVLKYYNDFLFESKKKEINLIKEIIENNNENFEEYLKDLDIARNMNERYEIIKYIYDSKFKDKEKSETNMNDCVQSWNQFEKYIKDKKLAKLRIEVKQMLLEYFKDEKNKDKLLKIFNEDKCKYFIEEISKLLNAEFNKLKEVLKYFNDFLFESKLNDINSIKEIIKNNNVNFQEYLKYLDIARDINAQYEFIKFIYDFKYKDQIEQEMNVNNCFGIWDNLKTSIKDKELKNVEKEDKIIFLEFFNDKNNKEKLLKIFNEEDYEYFITETTKELKDDLEEILKYYNDNLLESKKDDINSINEIIKTGTFGINIIKYFKDYQACKQNEKLNINNNLVSDNINLDNIKDIDIKKMITEYEKPIKDKQIFKIKREIRDILFNYFKDEKNKESLLAIFDQDTINNFIEQNNNINNLIEILNYYNNFLWETKEDDISIINNYITKGEGDCNKYLEHSEIALKMKDRYNIIDYIFKIKNKDVAKTEKLFNHYADVWGTFEKIIKEKKLKKIKLHDKHIIYDFFNGNENKIFDNECYQYFIKDYLSCKEKSKLNIVKF